MSFIELSGIEGLYGELKVQGSKNSILPMMAASIINKGITVFHNCPHIADVDNTIAILNSIGCSTKWDNNSLIIDSTEISKHDIPYDYAKSMRSSVIFAGAMLARCNKVIFTYPGGCIIGKRPINWHLQYFRNIGVNVIENEENILCERIENFLTNNDIFLQYPSVGVTENIILASILNKGVTRIYNYAKEPEVIELCSFLNDMGALIIVRPEYILVLGVSQNELHDVEHTINSDRIVAGTYIMCIAMTGGEVILEKINPKWLRCPLYWLKKMGVNINEGNDYIRVVSDAKLMGGNKIITNPYPDFPTDLQPQMMALFTKTQGVNIIIENIFENRYKTANELIKMGADITINGRRAIICGKKIRGCDVEAKDLRSGAALIIAGCGAEGKTRIYHPEYIYRGYEDICRDLNAIGANMKKGK